METKRYGWLTVKKRKYIVNNIKLSGITEKESKVKILKVRHHRNEN